MRLEPNSILFPLSHYTYLHEKWLVDSGLGRQLAKQNDKRRREEQMNEWAGNVALIQLLSPK